MKMIFPAKLMALTFLFLTLATIQATGQSVTLNIAVNDLKVSGIDQSTADIMSDRLRSELVNTGAFRVMERGEMQSILKEQGFQQTGACEESSCLVQVGQLLGVQRMVAGSIGRVDNFWTMSLRMLNVATGEILFTVSDDYRGNDVGEVISQVTVKAVAKLVSAMGNEVKKTSMTGKKGDLYIESSQPGATVEIDGMSLNNVTPFTLQGYAAGDHRIVVRKGDWFGSKTVTLNPDDLLKVSIDMEQGKGSVKIFSTPNGVKVSVDGKEMGETPLKLDHVQTGAHELVFSKDGYVDQKQTVQVSIGETKNISLSLREAAYLSIKLFPEKAGL